MVIFSAIKTVLQEKNYFTKFIVLLAVIGTVSLFFMNFVSLPGLVYGELLLTDTITLENAAFLIFFSFLASAAAVLHLYKFDRVKKTSLGEKSAGIAGAFFGLFTTACPVCYPLVLTSLGIPTALGFLPFGGIELQALSIGLLALSIYFVSRSIVKENLCVVTAPPKK